MLNADEITSKVIDIVNRQLRLDLTPNMTFLKLREDLEADSIDIVNIIVQLEIAFHLPIFDDEIEKLRSIDDLIDFIFKYTNDDYYVKEDQLK